MSRRKTYPLLKVILVVICRFNKLMAFENTIRFIRGVAFIKKQQRKAIILSIG